jgi:hypothetical protein
MWCIPLNQVESEMVHPNEMMKMRKPRSWWFDKLKVLYPPEIPQNGSVHRWVEEDTTIKVKKTREIEGER